MDYIPSDIFHFDQTDELFHMSCFPCSQQHDEILEDQIPPTPSHSGGDINLTHDPKFGRRRRLRSSVISFDENDDDHENPNANKKKKVVHREIERQRRQETAALYSSIRSLLPPEYLRGKRSISDHMHEAANYIKDLNKRIQELSDKGDELKSMKSPLSPSTAQQQDSQRRDSDSVEVRFSGAGMEVIINTALRQGLPLSSVLKVIIAEGLTINSCVSTKVNERLLHTIDIEVNKSISMDPSELEQKLKNLEY
ncbi:transcription factor bHLH120 [Ziziphus jujuba]|uniref:Transcription factor bHLH120 n=1 Tax=Ziziphus jujuba TaxID=326968 RepID=A0A6P4BMG4_ZIZJJ|nr:transcription factor bHLH120 [Ziziphus jujuba]